jgi:hypothetical protein
MRKRGAAVDRVVVLASLRNDRGIAELSPRPSAGVGEAQGRGRGIGPPSPNGSNIVNHASEVSTTVMMYP